MTTAPVVDPGTSNERTALAWQRTALSLVAACAALARVTWDVLGFSALVIQAVAAALALWVVLESRRRYAGGSGESVRPHRRDGAAPLALAGSALLIGATELAALALR